MDSIIEHINYYNDLGEIAFRWSCSVKLLIALMCIGFEEIAPYIWGLVCLVDYFKVWKREMLCNNCRIVFFVGI